MNKKNIVALVLASVLTGGLMAPVVAQTPEKREARQKDKNLTRNIGMGLGAAAAYKALKGDWKSGLALGAGAAYAGKKYEDARKAQAKENNAYRRVYRYRNGKRVGYTLYKGDKRVRYVSLKSRRSS